MDIINIKATASTPCINFNAETGELSISGRSIHENPVIFYQPLIDWLDHYIAEPASHTNLHLNLDYSNTSSSKWIFAILKKLKSIRNNGHSAAIIWKYHIDDEDMLQNGQIYSEVLEMPFEFIEQD